MKRYLILAILGLVTVWISCNVIPPAVRFLRLVSEHEGRSRDPSYVSSYESETVDEAHRPHSHTFVQWTPDGEFILIGYTIARPDGSGERELIGATNEYVDYSAVRLSPDGSRIVYTTTQGTKEEGRYSYDIEISALDGSNRWRLTSSAAVDAGVTWSPDGSRIAFFRTGPGRMWRQGARLHTIAPDGSDLRPLVIDSIPESDPERGGSISFDLTGPATWSPDGKEIAILVEEFHEIHYDADTTTFHGIPAIHIVNADGSGSRRVYGGTKLWWENPAYKAPASAPAWSPDGRRLAFLQYEHIAGDYQLHPRLYTIGADGSDLKALAALENGAIYWQYPRVDWSPDGSTILASTGHMYLVAPDGSAVRYIGGGWHASWSPDGSQIGRLILYKTPDPGGYMRTESLLSAVSVDHFGTRLHTSSDDAAYVWNGGDAFRSSHDAAVGAGLSLTVGVGGFLVFRKRLRSRRADVERHG